MMMPFYICPLPPRYKQRVAISSLSLVLLLSGCSAIVKTPYHTPNLDLPTRYTQTQAASNDALAIEQIQDKWWTVFQDSALNQLVELALQRNTDLAVAGIRLKQARERAGLAYNQQLPRVSANGTASHTVQLHNGDDQSRGLNLSGSLSYELDLWGKLSQQSAAAQWEAQASAEDLQNTAQLLIGTVCRTYWQIAYLNQRLVSSEDSVNSSKKLLKLVQAQYNAGAVSGLELAQAKQAVVSQEANHSQLLQQRVEARNTLAILLDQPNADSAQQLVPPESQQLNQHSLPSIDAGLPVTLLARRPDLQAAELRLRKVLATADATQASYYPSINLSSSLGSSSTSLTELIKNPVLTLGAGISLPFLQYNDMQRNIAISKLDYDSAVLNFRKTLYNALVDVDNALSAAQQLAVQANAQQRTLDLAKQTESLTEIRYRAGAVALKQWIDAQESRRNANNNLIQVRLNQLNNHVTLLQSLGGRPLQP